MIIFTIINVKFIIISRLLQNIRKLSNMLNSEINNFAFQLILHKIYVIKEYNIYVIIEVQFIYIYIYIKLLCIYVLRSICMYICIQYIYIYNTMYFKIRYMYIHTCYNNIDYVITTYF